MGPLSSTKIVSLSKARKSGALSHTDNLKIDLLLGKFFGQLHSGVQNDWYGLPLLDGEQPRDPSYSWQETFTSLLEGLLAQIQAHSQEYECELPYEEIRLCLSRAIGSFLFDDVEVPSLVWFTGSEDDVYITLPSDESSGRGAFAAVLPNVAHALWGDPLLECFMMESGSVDGEWPSVAFMEGYVGGGGAPLTVFPRQKTKRMWYTFFLALVVLTKYGVPKMGGGDEETFVREKRKWARDTLRTCVEDLKNAPCY